jgi:hypothetical protein
VVEESWKRRWSELGPERRRRIARAIQRGEAVTDVRDAPLAVELIDRKLRHAARFHRARRWFSIRHLAVMATLGIPLAIMTHDVLPVVVLVLLAVYLLPLTALVSKLEARAKVAREKNAQIADSFD